MFPYAKTDLVWNSVLHEIIHSFGQIWNTTFELWLYSRPEFFFWQSILWMFTLFPSPHFVRIGSWFWDVENFPVCRYFVRWSFNCENFSTWLQDSFGRLLTSPRTAAPDVWRCSSFRFSAVEKFSAPLHSRVLVILVSSYPVALQISSWLWRSFCTRFTQLLHNARCNIMVIEKIFVIRICFFACSKGSFLHKLMRFDLYPGSKRQYWWINLQNLQLSGQLFLFSLLLRSWA